jgi:fructokinase
MFGGVEAGGTSFVCAVGTGPRDLRARTVIATRAPEETVAQVVAHLRHHQLRAIGAACFRPLDLVAGRIISTPKPGWEGAEVIGAIRAAFGDLAVGFDTDVNGAGLAEWRWGAAQGLDTFTDLTVGAGIGGGGMVGGQLMHGLVHPEMGHMRLPRHPADPLERGACPFHDDCWEAWAAREAIERRLGRGLPGDGAHARAGPRAARPLHRRGSRERHLHDLAAARRAWRRHRPRRRK